MTSIASKWLKLQLRLAKPLVTHMSLEATRKGQDRLGFIGLRALESRVNVEDIDMGEFMCSLITPVHGVMSGRAILYLHGGAYTAGSLNYSRGFGSVLADETGLPTLCVAYRLAPEHPYPAALDDAVMAYKWLSDNNYNGKTLVMGESAGGGLAFALGLYLRDKGIEMPTRIVGISPWTDLTLSGYTYSAFAQRDPTLSAEQLARQAMRYAAGAENDPYVSPAFGDYKGFPPSLIFAGGDELLLSDAVELYHRLRLAGTNTKLHIEPKMWHVYPIYGTPESRKAMEMIKEFAEAGL